MPMSLLATLKFAGITSETLQPEIIFVDAISSNVTRPSVSTTYACYVENNYADGVTSVDIRATIDTYHVNDGTYGYYDWTNIKAIVIANATQGFMHSLILHFDRMGTPNIMYGSSVKSGDYINILTHPVHLVVHNLIVEEVKDRPLTDPSFIATIALDKPDHCDLTSNFNWVLIDQRDLDHFLTITAEVMIFNGTAYQKLVLPVQIGMVVS